MIFLAGSMSLFTLGISIAQDEAQPSRGYLTTPQELALIDRYEGDDYQRIQVTLTSQQMAWVYRAAG